MKLIKTTTGKLINVNSISAFEPLDQQQTGVIIRLSCGHKITDTNLTIANIASLISIVKGDDMFPCIYAELIKQDYHVVNLSDGQPLYKVRVVN